jgi:hypothetical protein
MRSSLALLSVLVALAGSLPLVAADGAAAQKPASEPPRGYSSPREAFYAYRKALEERDWRTFFSCLTPRYQDLHIEEVIFESETQPRARHTQLTAILKKYGVDLAQLNAELAGRKVDTETAWRTVVQRVTDKARLFEEASAIIHKPDPVLPRPRVGDLEVLRVDGNTATGHAKATDFFLHSANKIGQWTYVKVFHFRRLNGRWFVAHASEQPRSPEKIRR